MISDINKIIKQSEKDEVWIKKRLSLVKNRKTIREKDLNIVSALIGATEDYIESLKWTLNKIGGLGDIGQSRFAKFKPVLENQISQLIKLNQMMRST